MRAADDFAVIRARIKEIEREREWAAHKHERALRDEEADWRTVHDNDLKARVLARNRLG
jgi:hypothetical protein